MLAVKNTAEAISFYLVADFTIPGTPDILKNVPKPCQINISPFFVSFCMLEKDLSLPIWE